jgi:sRNA-binding protein
VPATVANAIELTLRSVEVSPLRYGEHVTVKVGLAAPYVFVAALVVQVIDAGVTVRVPSENELTV